MAKKPTLKDVEKQSKRTTTALEAKAAEDAQALLKAIKTLERRIISEFSNLTVSDMGNLVGPRVNLKKSQALHKRLVQIYEEEYGKVVRSNVAGYKEVEDWIIENFKEFDIITSFTDVDKQMLSQLRKQTILEFAEVAARSQTRIAQALYNMVATSAPFDDLVKEIEGALVGQVDAKGKPLSQYAELYANDGLRNYYNTVHLEKGRSAGLRDLLYFGNVMATTRDFCRKRVMKIYSIAEVNSWTFDWAGKRGPALQYRGGWNCRHHWRMVKKSWFD